MTNRLACQAMDQHRNTTATVRAVLAAASDKGVSPTDLLAQAGIDDALAHDPDGEVTLPQMKRFWETAYRLSGDPYLAINAGIRAAHGSYKTLDYMFLASKTVEDGITAFVNHFRLINTWLNFEIAEAQDQVHVTLDSQIGPVPHPAVEITFAVFTERLRQVLGSGWAPARVRFLHKPVGEASFYEGFFRAPVSFGDGSAAISFTHDQWTTALPGGDEGLFRVLSNHAELLGAARPDPDDPVARARAEILRVLKNGVPTIEETAQTLGIGTRTFQRRLSDQELTFSQIVDQVREEHARDLVATGALSLSEVAFFLGFADQSAFSRAFKRWTGQTPRAYRADA